MGLRPFRVKIRAILCSITSKVGPMESVFKSVDPLDTVVKNVNVGGMNTKSKVSLRNLHKSFGESRILKGVDFEAQNGDSLVLFGESGSGKSVLLKCILGLVALDAGNILIDGTITNGHGTDKDSKHLNKIGMLFQRSALFDSLTVWENVVFRLLQSKACDPIEGKKLALQKLALVRMGTGAADLMPSELSGGMQKRVGLARAIAGDPQILLLDEPTAGLDPILSNGISELVADIIKELNTTVISITNDIDSAQIISSKAAMLYNGQIIWQGLTNSIEKSDNPHVQKYIKSWMAERSLRKKTKARTKRRKRI